MKNDKDLHNCYYHPCLNCHNGWYADRLTNCVTLGLCKKLKKYDAEREIRDKEIR